MTNPTRQEILDAHEALNSLLKLASGTSTASAIFAWETVRAALPPKPQPTMAEAEWDDDKHYLAEAQHPVWGSVVMLNYDTDQAKIQYICYEKPGRTGFASPKNLTPTGYQCTLTEVQE